jgi:cytochrome P450
MQANFERYGDLFSAPISQGYAESLTFVSHPQALQYILTHDHGPEITAPGEANLLFQSLLGNNSMILLSGAQHRSRRQLVMPPFHGDRLKAYGDLICQVTRDAIATWPLDQPFQMRSRMQQITMRVILQAVFGLYEGERYSRLETLLGARLDASSRGLGLLAVFFPILQKDLGPWSPGHRIHQMAQEIDTLLYAEIRERRANLDPDRTDILSLLLLAQDDQGQGLSDEELHDELMTLLIAGHETTATALTWALYWLHRDPQIHEKLRAELNDLGDAADPMTVSRLPYLTAVCNETLRIYPVGMITFPRQVAQPITLMDYDIPVGTLLLGSIYLLHWRPDLYPNPQDFRPERFLERQFSPYEFMPFGGGSRRCVGAALAQLEMKLVLSTILSQCELALATDRPVRPRRRGLTLGPGDGVVMRQMAKRAAQPTLALTH